MSCFGIHQYKYDRERLGIVQLFDSPLYHLCICNIKCKLNSKMHAIFLYPYVTDTNILMDSQQLIKIFFIYFPDFTRFQIAKGNIAYR
jgi:hypothetical protein